MKPYQFVLFARGKVSMTLAQLIIETESFVAHQYGIRNLSIIERMHLKKCCERIGQLVSAQWKQCKFNPKMFSSIPDPRHEAAWAFIETIGDLSSDVMKDAVKKYVHLGYHLSRLVLIRRIRAHGSFHEEVMIGRSDKTGPVELK